ncbi:MAG: DUF1800 family protein [Opitutaceae bacterium]|nr:DUF1800 family protein [Verrucomicrobiales bacterium]
MLKWAPYPSADLYTIRRTPSLDQPFLPDASGMLSNNTFFPSMAASNGFFSLEVVPMPTNRLQAATVLNRLTYGPTPDDLESLSTNSVSAFIEQQLAPETISEIGDSEITFTNTVGQNTFQWIYVQQTGTFTANGTNGLYIYLNGSGTAYVDDLKLVAGTNLAGANLIPTGDFESPLSPPWILGTNCLNSVFSNEASKSGGQSLKLVFSTGGSSGGSAVHFTNTSLGLPLNGVCTLSYWYVPSTNRQLTIRFSNNGINTTPDVGPGAINRRLIAGRGSLSDLRRWYSRRAVHANRQLLEVMTQFWDNHFVTQHTKSRDYLDRYYDDFTYMDVLAAELEYREINKWRAKMMDPNATFYDMLRISAESPAMIIYLDTVRSRGNGGSVANENYARELLELFTFGVDNGYDQADIVTTSKAWTGWTINLVDPAQASNPFLTNYVYNAGSAYVTNLPGIWTFSYMSSNHNNTAKTIFTNKTVPPRFGSPWAGNPYQLILPLRTNLATPSLSIPNGGTNGMADGYEVIAHLANQPFTMEFISVKLCRWFVHDDFDHGVYDYTDPNMTPEARLVHDCMLAWHNATPRGNLRTVLRTIFNSELFRTHGAAGQKVKTPLEFAASTMRVLRSIDSSGVATADTDGNFTTALTRMGSMLLFDRAEPDGYPESAPGWISAGTLTERLRFAQSVLMSSNLTQSVDPGTGFRTDPVGLLKRKLPQVKWDVATDIADYFLSIIYPGEGRANLDPYKSVAVSFLNTANDGVTASLFANLGNTTPAYDQRVRGMVAMLLTLPRFQEQ